MAQHLSWWNRHGRIEMKQRDGTTSLPNPGYVLVVFHQGRYLRPRPRVSVQQRWIGACLTVSDIQPNSVKQSIYPSPSHVLGPFYADPR